MTKLENGIIEEIEFPDFDSIIAHCKTIMALKFPSYKTMETQDICALPVNDISDEDSILFLWVVLKNHNMRCMKNYSLKNMRGIMNERR